MPKVRKAQTSRKVRHDPLEQEILKDREPGILRPLKHPDESKDEASKAEDEMQEDSVG